MVHGSRSLSADLIVFSMDHIFRSAHYELGRTLGNTSLGVDSTPQALLRALVLSVLVSKGARGGHNSLK